MSSPSSIAAALLVFLAPIAGAQANPITTPFQHFEKGYAKHLLDAAQAMPADKYGFKPTPAQWTFGKLMTHIVEDSRITCTAIAGGTPPAAETLTGTESKDKIVAALQSVFDQCSTAVNGVTDAQLTTPVQYYGSTSPRVHALIGMVEDWSDHYGQAAQYLRLNGILPPTAKKGE